MRAQHLAFAATVLVLTGCAASPARDDGRGSTTTTVQLERREPVTCHAPVSPPNRAQIDNLIGRYSGHVVNTPAAERVREHFAETYRQEVMLYRLCLDYAEGRIDGQQYARSRELVFSCAE